MNSQYFQDKPITVQQMTHSISLHTEFISVCAHQMEGGEAGREDGVGMRGKNLLAPSARGEGCEMGMAKDGGTSAGT